MKEIWRGRLVRAAGRYGEHAPLATTCCNACRTCVQTNLISLGVAAVLGAGAGVTRVAARIAGRRQ